MTIFDAVKTGDLDKVQKLIEEYPKIVHARDENQRTPIDLAARKRS